MNKKEKTLLAVVDLKKKSGWSVEDITNELEELVSACEGEVVEKVFCRVDKPSAATLIGEGKLKEIAELSGMLNVKSVIFSHDLKGSQQRNIEDVVNVKTIDRTQLILDIFARHARSQEGKMQVELAQLEYLLPRLVGKGIELSRLGGGIGTLGPGETKLEVDRRRIGQRIAKLKKDLDDVSSSRALKRKRRQEKGVPTISIVGYTNAGKSTLINTLTEAKRLTRNGLFTTLDSLARQYVLPNHQKLVVTDTVGFIHELPHHLVESFKATLEEVKEADLLLHVVDVNHPHFRNFYEAVVEVLGELGAGDKPVIVVLNKIDLLKDKAWLKDLKQNFDNAVSLSAKTGENIEELNQLIAEKLSALMVEIKVTFPINRMDLVNLVHQEGQVFSIKYYNETIHLRASVPTRIAGKFREFSSFHE